MKKAFGLLLLSIFFSACSSDDGPITPIIVDEDDDPIALTSAICEGGLAGIYPCNDYNLVSLLNLSVFNAQRANDSWGWTDPNNNREYVLQGLNNGTAFIDISDPSTPIYLGKLPTRSGNSNWRDVKVYNNFAFIVSEAPGHGMQVFDLTKLRSVTNPPAIFEADAIYSEFGNAHNIVINPSSGYAYVVGTETFNGGPHFIDIQDPLNPIAAGGYELSDYSHDAQVVTYNGPDSDHTGREILIGSNVDEVVIVDITEKDNPQLISTVQYSQTGYTHQGWFTENQRYFILGDELDEIDFGTNSRTIIFDFSDLENPLFHAQYLGPTAAIDHNGYVKGNRYYQANYTGGLRVVDISNIASGNLTEVGFFDTFPSNDAPSFSGVWNVYPFFSSGNIVISDIETGLYIVKKK